MPGPDLPLLESAARQAGAIALRYFRRDPQVWDKGGDQGPVTEADLAVNDYLKGALRAARPDYGWLSEESPDDPQRLNCARVFIVDPIDGTRAFISGEDNFAISIAVAERGQIIAGAVYLPAKNRLYTAELGGVALRDGKAISASSRAELTGSHVLATRINMMPEFWPKGVPDLQRSFRTSLAWNRARCRSWSRARTSSSQPLLMWDRRTPNSCASSSVRWPPLWASPTRCSPET